MTWIHTHSGEKFDLVNPTPEQIHLPDIAHALSLLCRYTGHTRKFYSVAEHSILMSLHAENMKLGDGDRRLLRTFLLHDASEAYVGDLNRPLKQLLPEYQAVEDKVQVAIAKRFDLIYPYPKVVHEYDTRILMDEKEVLLSPGSWDLGVAPLGISDDIIAWGPLPAERLFLARSAELDVTV